MPHPTLSRPLQLVRSHPWLTLITALVLALLVGGAIFAAGTTTVVVSLTPDGNINEGAGTVTFRVRLTDAIADGQVQVRVRSVDGAGANGALSGSDFVVLDQVVTLTPSTQFADLTLTVNDDTVDELNETFTVSVELVSNTSSSTVLFGSPYTAVIEDNDSPTLTSIAGPGTVSEAVGNASFVITMAQSSPQPVIFNWTVVPVAPDGVTLPPAADADVTVASGVWTIPANTPAGPTTFTIGIVNDTTDENDEQFRVDITSVSNIANPDDATSADPLVTIDDDDGVPTVTTNTGLTVLEAGSGTIAQANLEATDAEQTPAQLTFTVVTAPANGTLFRNATALAASGTFTQADINGNLISYTHNGGETTTDSLVFTVSDGTTTTTNQTFTFTITPVNDAPSFTKGADVTVAEDSGAYSQPWATAISAGTNEITQTVTFEITANDNAALFSVGPAVAADGTLSFTPAANAFGTATMQVRIVDDGGTANGGVNASAPQSFTITVNNVNDAPSFTAGPNVTVNEDSGAYSQPWATAISAGPANEAGQTVSFEITANSNAALFSAGPAVAADGTLSFTPAANAFGTATVQVRIVDDGGTANGGVNASAPQSFTITVTSVNDAPSFTKGADVTVAEDSGAYSQPWATAISAGPANEAGQTVTFEITANDNAALFSVGPAVAADGTLSFTPAANAFGTATVQVRIVDDGGTANGGVNASAPQSFTITVTSVNDLPTAVNDAYSTNEETQLLVTAGAGVLANDSDVETPQAALVVGSVNGSAANVGAPITTANGGTLQVNADGSLSYLPAVDFFGDDSFTYTVRDTDNGERQATVTITVVNTNDPPALVVNTGLTLDEGATATIAAAQLAFSDPDHTPGQLIFTITDATDVGTLRRGATALGLNGTFSQADINGGSLSYTHDGSESPTTDSFSFSLSDGTAPPLAGTFTITITPVNDRPVVDANGASGGINYTVPAGYVEQAAPITIVDPALTVSDADSANLQQVTVSIGAPVTTDETLAVDATAATSAGITPSYNSATGVLTLTGPASLANFQTVLRTLTYVSSAENPPTSRTITILATDAESPSADADPAAVITLNIQAVNDPPSIAASSLTLNEGATVNVTPANLRADDPDTPAADLRFTVTAPPTRGILRRDGIALAINSFFTQAQIDSGSLSYEHNGGETTSDSVGFRVSDGVNPAVNGTLVITIVLVNDAPVITLTLGATPYLAGDPAVVIDAGATISDADSLDFDGGALRVALTGGGAGDTLAIRNEGNGPGQVGVSGTTVSVGGAAIGTFSVGAGGQPLVVSLNSAATPTTVQAVARNITFANAAAAPAGGPRTATFTLSDGDGETSTPVDKVIAFNRAPTANDDSLRAFINDSAAPLAVLANDSDPDGDPLTITAVTQGTNGTVAITGGGSGLAYTPTPGFVGSDSFTYTVSDGQGGVDTATVRLTVTRVVVMFPLLSVPPRPDLTVSFQVNPASPQAGRGASIAVTVTNVGTGPASNFWVDFYIEPTRAPQVNEPWNELCRLETCFGLAWYYTGNLAPGQSVVLNSQPQSAANPNGYTREASTWPGFFANGTTRLYALADSWNRDASGTIRNPAGAIQEIDETNNLATQSIVVTPGILPPLLIEGEPAEPRRYRR